MKCARISAEIKARKNEGKMKKRKTNAEVLTSEAVQKNAVTEVTEVTKVILLRIPTLAWPMVSFQKFRIFDNPFDYLWSKSKLLLVG